MPTRALVLGADGIGITYSIFIHIKYIIIYTFNTTNRRKMSVLSSHKTTFSTKTKQFLKQIGQ